MESTTPCGAVGEGSRKDVPGAARRPRIVLEDLAAVPPEELPDVARELRTLRRILDVNKRLSRVDEEEALLDALLDAALALMGAERAFLVAPDGGGDLLVLRARDLAGGTPAAEVPAAVVRRVLVERETFATGDASRDVRLDGPPSDGMRSLLCAPLPGPEARALYLDAREADLFGAPDAELLALLAEQAAVALERVRLLRENRRQHGELIVAAETAERLNRRLAELLERRTAELREARDDLLRAGVDDSLRSRFPAIVGRGSAMTQVLQQVERVADTSVPVLFEGESGTGKELLARALHAASRRASGRFVAENCAALPETLLENELFGHERGAFTGADAQSQGLFERADGGTLFLDEVGDMSVGLQKRLLRVLQEGEVRRVGGTSVRRVDVRIVTATNRDLLRMVHEGRFREDLYYRLAVVKIRVPPLRERREDVPALVEHFLRRACEGRELPEIDLGAMDALVSCEWPGNIRQLDNEIRRATALCRGTIGVEALSPEVREGTGRLNGSSAGAAGGTAASAGDGTAASAADGRDLRAQVEELEVRCLRAALERERGNITRAAGALGLSRLGLRKKMQRYGIARDVV